MIGGTASFNLAMTYNLTYYVHHRDFVRQLLIFCMVLKVHLHFNLVKYTEPLRVHTTEQKRTTLTPFLHYNDYLYGFGD